MKRYLIIITTALALALAASAAASGTWRVTEARAEQFVAGAVRYTDADALDAYNARVANRRAALDEAKARLDALGGVDASLKDSNWWSARNAYVMARDQYGAVVGTGCGCVYRPVRIDCRGASPSSDAYHFTRFRCQALFRNQYGQYAGWGRVILTVVGSKIHWEWV